MSAEDDPRIGAILEVLHAFARQDFSRKAPIGDQLDAVDAIAAGLNMLAEELDGAVASRRELEDGYRSLQEAQARLVHSGKLVAIGQLASGVAHEINNPAAWVTLSLTLFSRRLTELREVVGDGLPPERQAKVELLLAESERALADAAEGMARIRAVTGDLRTFSRSDGDEREPVALDDVVRSACNLAAPMIRGTAKLELRSEGDVTIDGNRGRLAQVVTNLVVNAVQAVGARGADNCRIQVETRREGDQVVLRVDDGGPGIPRELRSRVFEPFFTTKAPDAGTGLGLALVAEIIQRHGGSVQIEDSELGGARFTVRLPAAAARGETFQPAAVGPGQSESTAGRKRLLIVDDELRLLQTYALVLEPYHDVCLADGGRAALARLETDRAFDLIVCDLQMPDVDGVDVYERVLALDPALARRIVFSTGGAFQPRAREFLARVAPPVLQKPVRAEELLAHISRSTA